MYLCYSYLPHLPGGIFSRGSVVCKCRLYFRGKWAWTYSGLLIIWDGQRQQLGLTSRTLPLGGRDEETEDYRNQLHWGAGLQGCRKGSVHPDPEDQKVEEIHMPLCCIWKGFVFFIIQGDYSTNDRRKFELSWPFKHYYSWRKWGTGQ